MWPRPLLYFRDIGVNGFREWGAYESTAAAGRAVLSVTKAKTVLTTSMSCIGAFEGHTTGHQSCKWISAFAHLGMILPQEARTKERLVKPMAGVLLNPGWVPLQSVNHRPIRAQTKCKHLGANSGDVGSPRLSLGSCLERQTTLGRTQNHQKIKVAHKQVKGTSEVPLYPKLLPN